MVWGSGEPRRVLPGAARPPCVLVASCPCMAAAAASTQVQCCSSHNPLPWGCMKQLKVSACERTCNDAKTVLQRGHFLEQLDLDHCAGLFLCLRSTQAGEEMMVPNSCRREGRGTSFSNVLGLPCSSKGCGTVPGQGYLCAERRPPAGKVGQSLALLSSCWLRTLVWRHGGQCPGEDRLFRMHQQEKP